MNMVNMIDNNHKLIADIQHKSVDRMRQTDWLQNGKYKVWIGWGEPEVILKS
jgi:hypothetical protein